MEENNKIPADYQISYFVHQEDMNMMDMSHKRVEKWLLIFCFILLVALVGSNAAWIHYENQFQDEITVMQDTPNGNNNYVGRDGDITNGATGGNKETN